MKQTMKEDFQPAKAKIDDIPFSLLFILSENWFQSFANITHEIHVIVPTNLRCKIIRVGCNRSERMLTTIVCISANDSSNIEVVAKHVSQTNCR